MGRFPLPWSYPQLSTTAGPGNTAVTFPFTCSGLASTGRDRPKLQFTPRELSFDCLMVPWKTPLASVFLTWSDYKLAQYKNTFPSCDKLQATVLTSLLPKTVDNSWSKQQTTKNLKQKNWGRRFTEELWKTGVFLEIYKVTCMPRVAHMLRKRSEKP